MVSIFRSLTKGTAQVSISAAAAGLSTLIISSATDAQPQKIGQTLAESQEQWAPLPQAPKGAPNVVWILLDDVGYGATSAFGGQISTPNFDTLANDGLRYTNFHTCAISAPTRAALLTGRNSARVHVSGFSHIVMSAGFPGWDGRLPSSAGTIAETLRENGYNTFAVGKYGITPDEEANDAGPFTHWPTQKGFDHFFGFLGSQTDQYDPDLVEDQAFVKPDGRHLSEQITDKAISYITRQQKAAPGKPFFLYYAPGAVHSPHQVDTAWSNQYKGKFDSGWDAYRETVLANQKKLGVVPANAKLPPRNDLIPAWNTLSSDQKKVYSRFMEVYAGYLTYTDYQVGRVVNYLKQNNLYENTVIFLLIGDNGASKEGDFSGNLKTESIVNAISDSANFAYNLAHINDIGTPAGKHTNYPLGWAQATNAPFKFWKQDANSEGGTHNPLIVHFPKNSGVTPGIRNQYSHVNDIYPTTLELTGVTQPESIRGVKQDSLQGVSLAYSFKNAAAPSRHTEQYYYIFGSRSIYKDGWKAAAAHHPSTLELTAARLSGKPPVSDSFEKDTWELYNMNEDFNELNNLASKYPEKLAALKAEFDSQAKANHLYPFITWSDILGGKLQRVQKLGFGAGISKALGKETTVTSESK